MHVLVEIDWRADHAPEVLLSMCPLVLPRHLHSEQAIVTEVKVVKNRAAVGQQDLRNTTAIPISRAETGLVGLRPLTSTTPVSGARTPPNSFASVLLPLPFSPTTAWISPERAVNEQLRSAAVAPNDLLTSRTITASVPTRGGEPTGGGTADVTTRSSPLASRSLPLNRPVLRCACRPI